MRVVAYAGNGGWEEKGEGGFAYSNLNCSKPFLPLPVLHTKFSQGPRLDFITMGEAPSQKRGEQFYGLNRDAKGTARYILPFPLLPHPTKPRIL